MFILLVVMMLMLLLVVFVSVGGVSVYTVGGGGGPEPAYSVYINENFGGRESSPEHARRSQISASIQAPGITA